MNTAISTPTATPPSAPGIAHRDGRPRSVQPELGAVDRQHRRHPLQRPPLDDRPASRPRAANRIAQPTGTSYSDTGLATGTYYYRVTAEDAAGNVGPASNEASAVATGDRDSTPPTAPVGDRRPRQHGQPLLDAQRPTTSPSPATTSIAARRRLHALGGEPDRAADRHELHRRRARRRHLLLQGHRRGRRRQRRAGVERGDARPSPATRPHPLRRRH